MRRELKEQKMRRFLLIVMVANALSSAAWGATPFHVGVANREFLQGDPMYNWRGAKTHALITTIWYPASVHATETPQSVGDPAHPFASAGLASRDAELAATPKKFPLILLSHGTGGSALMMAWLGTELAAHGYIAVAVNHPGNNSLEPHTVQGFTLWWERATDLSRVLDGMLSDSKFGNRIDLKRMGAAGFSIGGYTMMELAGGIGEVKNLDEIERRCGVLDAADPMCASPPEFPGLVQKAVKLSETDTSYAAELKKSNTPERDPRIRAVFAIAPGNGQLFSPDTLSKISIPVEIVAGTSDTNVPLDDNARYFAAHIPHAKLRMYPPGVAHYTFLDTCTELGKKESPELCIDGPGIQRDAIHAEAAQEAIEFFDDVLKP
jgi:predicted dienelactone hydrolase